MNRLLNPTHWLRALVQPLVLLGLVVDLLPIYGVLAWGWGALPLVMLYWMENIIAGVMTIPRIVIAGGSFGGMGFFAGIALSAFFVFHYGLFCAVHGTFLIAFSQFGPMMQGEVAPDSGAMPMMDIPGMFTFGINSGPHVDWMLYLIVGFQALVFLWEFVLKGEWKTTNPMAEMFAPYGRIIVLHLALFVGAAALFLLGQPLVGVLALIVLRAAFGVVQNSDGVFGLDSSWSQAMDKMAGREPFEKAMRGEKID